MMQVWRYYENQKTRLSIIEDSLSSSYSNPILVVLSLYWRRYIILTRLVQIYLVTYE